MLVLAHALKDELQALNSRHALDESNKYVSAYGYAQLQINIKESTWHSFQFACVHPKKPDFIIGYIELDREHPQETVDNISIKAYSNAEDHTAILAGDFKIAVQRCFTDWNIRKIKWNVLVGNPAEKGYNRLCKMLGGRVVGTFKDDAVNTYGESCDVKWYEVTKQNFLDSRKKKKK